MSQSSPGGDLGHRGVPHALGNHHGGNSDPPSPDGPGGRPRTRLEARGTVFAAESGAVQQDDPDDDMRTAIRQVMGVSAEEKGLEAAEQGLPHRSALV